MKKLLFVYFFLAFIISSSCGLPAKEKIAGKWKLTKISDETLGASDVSAFIEFTKEGKMIFQVDDESSECLWELSKDENSIILTEKNIRKNWNIISLKEHELIYKEENDTTEITLTK